MRVSSLRACVALVVTEDLFQTQDFSVYGKIIVFPIPDDKKDNIMTECAMYVDGETGESRTLPEYILEFVLVPLPL